MNEQEVKPCKFVNGACIHCEATKRDGCDGWFSSPKREWVGLTDEEIKHLYPYGRSVWGKETYEAIEKALKAKNDH
jgi:hypothetical protein